MNPRRIFLTVLIAGRIYSQEAPAEQSFLTSPVFRVLEESVVRKSNGDTVTFKKVEPPAVLAVQPQPAPILSAEEMVRIARLEGKEQRTLSVSATVHAGGVTVLRWSCGGEERLKAVCNVDFRHLAGLGSLETETMVYLLFMGLGVEEDELSAEEALAAKALPADGAPSLVLLKGIQMLSKEDEQAAAGMEVLLDHYEAHRDELVKLHEQREAERAALELAQRNTPPPGPKHAVIHFWPLQPAQKAALTEKMLRERGAK